METFERRSVLPVPPEALRAWHTRPGAFLRLSPPWVPARVDAEEGPFETRRVTLRMGPFRWVAQHEPHPDGFVDRMVEGPFAAWTHTHLFLPHPDGAELVDRVEWALPWYGGPGAALVRDQLARTFDWRHRRTREDLAMHRDHPPLRVAVTGASGLIGTELCAFLESGGHTVLRVVRRGEGVRWDPARGEIDAAALEGVDAVVHLAGETIGQRWTPEAKRRILESRVRGTEVLCAALTSLARPPKVLVAVSGVGYYGDRGDERLDETSGPGRGFTADVCQAWEAASATAEGAGIRVVRPRLGVVLSPKGGSLPRMLTPFRAGLGGPVGSGRQWFAWVALDDVIGAVHHAVYDTTMHGPVNVVAPEAVRQLDFARTLGRVLGRPAIAPLPAFAVRLAFGEMGEELLLAGQHVLPVKLATHGYSFRRPTLEAHLRAELGR